MLHCKAKQLPNVREVLHIMVVMPLRKSEAEEVIYSPSAVEELFQIDNEGEPNERIGMHLWL